MRIAGAQVRFVSMSLKDYIGTAYGVRPQQIGGPDWLGQERFDLAATIPSDGSAVQLPQMMRAMLADRFKMTMHRERREFPVYELRLAKDGPTFQPSTAVGRAARERPAESRPWSTSSPAARAQRRRRAILAEDRRSRLATTGSRSGR